MSMNKYFYLAVTVKQNKNESICLGSLRGVTRRQYSIRNDGVPHLYRFGHKHIHLW